MTVTYTIQVTNTGYLTYTGVVVIYGCLADGRAAGGFAAGSECAGRGVCHDPAEHAVGRAPT